MKYGVIFLLGVIAALLIVAYAYRISPEERVIRYEVSQQDCVHDSYNCPYYSNMTLSRNCMTDGSGCMPEGSIMFTRGGGR